MAEMNTVPRFTQTPVLASASATVANANRDGTGTVVALVTGNAAGTRITMIRIKAEVTTTAGSLRVMINDGTSYLIHEFDVDANTVSATNGGFSAEWVPTDPIILPTAATTINVATENAEKINVFAFGGDFA